MESLYHLNGKSFLKAELLNYAQNQLQRSDKTVWEKELFSFIKEWFNQSISITVRSSGSTGKSKEIKLLKRNMRLSAMKTIRFFDLGKGQNALLCLPVRYIAGKMMVIRAFEAGMNLITIKPESAPDLSGIKKIDFAAMTPHQVKSLLSKRLWVAYIRKLIVGGEAVGAELSNQVTKCSVTAYETYGMTETMSHVALREITADYPIPFRALPGVRFSTDERNCLRIEVDFLSSSIQTNDIVELISETSFIYKGRNDFIINTGGIKLNPEKMESDLQKATGIEVIVSSVPDKKYGEKVILVFSSRISHAEIEHIQRHFASDNIYCFVKNYTVIKNIPKTANGKTDRIALGQILTDERFVSESAFKIFNRNLL